MMGVRGLGKCFGSAQWAVKNLDLTVADGQLVMLLGANGAGKSTTINCLLDFLRPTEGRALVDGIVVAEEPLRARRQLAYLGETLGVYPSLNGTQNVVFFAGLGTSIRLTKQTAKNLLLSMGIAEDACCRPVREYSKGMRQKLGLAIALARESRNIVLDEPTSGLDPVSARQLMDRLRWLCQGGAAVLMTTHDVFRAADADRVCVMREGTLVATYERSQLGSMNMEREYLRVMQAA